MTTTKKKHRLQHFFVDANRINKSVLNQSGVIVALWAIATLLLFTVFSIYTYEMTKIYNTLVTVGDQTKTIAQWRELMPSIPIGVEQQKVYEAMVKAAFGTPDTLLQIGANIPIIWFSCMFFIPNFSSVTNWQTVWDNKMLTVTTGQIYVLISAIVAFIGLCLYLYLIASYGVKLGISKKRNFTNKYPLYRNDMGLYSTNAYVSFLIAVAIFFSFYSLAAALLMLFYMLAIKAIYKKIEKVNIEHKTNINLFKTSDLSYFKTLFIVMAVMIIYNLVNSFITSWLNVDITTVLNGLFAAGGIAVIIFSLVRNLLASSITDIRRKMKNIDKQIEQLRFFYIVRQEESVLDFEYAQIIPPILKTLIVKAQGSGKDITALKAKFDLLFEYTDFIKNFNFRKHNMSNKNRRNFILYRMYNEITSFEELEDIKVNLLKEFKRQD